MIISRTPVRCSLFGGGSDYPEWYMDNGGAILGFAINSYCDITIHKSGIVNKTFDIPIRSGLGTSSAYTVGLLRACTKFEPDVIARIAIEIERFKLGGNVGHQDQFLCALGGMLFIEFNDRGIFPKRIDRQDLEDNLMLFYTGVRGVGSYKVIEEQLSRIQVNKSTLKEIQALTYIALKTKGEDFGKLLNHTWELKRTLSPNISTEKIDDLYNRALKAGAIGGKLLGAGSGGYLLLYVDPDKQENVKREIPGYTPFKIDYEGTRIIYADVNS
jgi:D-glycero-alpha-D-manno-heptose-7-phosphate kinase